MSFSNSSPPRSRTLGSGGSLVMAEAGMCGAGQGQSPWLRRWQAWASRWKDWTNSVAWPVSTAFGHRRQWESNENPDGSASAEATLALVEWSKGATSLDQWLPVCLPFRALWQMAIRSCPRFLRPLSSFRTAGFPFILCGQFSYVAQLQEKPDFVADRVHWAPHNNASLLGSRSIICGEHGAPSSRVCLDHGQDRTGHNPY